MVRQFNKRWRRLVEGEREFMGLFYKYNTKSDSRFWDEARGNAYVGALAEGVRCYQEVGPDSIHRNLLLAEDDPIGLEGYFSVLIGQKVAHRSWAASAAEMQNWKKIGDSWRRTAANGFSVAEALRYFAGATAGAMSGVVA
jgi:hypothetical protein